MHDLKFLVFTEVDKFMVAAKIRQGGLFNASIPIPVLVEQRRVAAKVDELIALCDSLEVRLADTATAHCQLVEATPHKALLSRRLRTSLITSGGNR